MIIPDDDDDNDNDENYNEEVSVDKFSNSPHVIPFTDKSNLCEPTANIDDLIMN